MNVLPMAYEDAEEPILPETSMVTEEDDELPEGKMLPLNSKKLVLEQLRTLASMLGIGAAKATAAQTRQLIEGKLLELDREPRSVQVILGKDSRLYLVDETGIIKMGPTKESEGMEGTDQVITNELFGNEHESRDDSVELLRSALRKACLENERLKSQLSARNDELESVCNECDQLKTHQAELKSRLEEVSLEEIEQLKAALNSQTEKAKRFWRLRCEQMLAHDELIEAKEGEIISLRA